MDRWERVARIVACVRFVPSRQIRDDHKCYTKYKKDWETYCAKVPYRIVPYVY